MCVRARVRARGRWTVLNHFPRAPSLLLNCRRLQQLLLLGGTHTHTHTHTHRELCTQQKHTHTHTHLGFKTRSTNRQNRAVKQQAFAELCAVLRVEFILRQKEPCCVLQLLLIRLAVSARAGNQSPPVFFFFLVKLSSQCLKQLLAQVAGDHSGHSFTHRGMCRLSDVTFLGLIWRKDGAQSIIS